MEFRFHGILFSVWDFTSATKAVGPRGNSHPKGWYCGMDSPVNMDFFGWISVRIFVVPREFLAASWAAGRKLAETCDTKGFKNHA
jgi:hypothetical protein